MSPFDYPPRHERQHGPRGYLSYDRYLPWLGDEFAFRCVYCLSREQWVVRMGGFAIDHFLPTALQPEHSLEYGNLLYACNACNLVKGKQIIPDPSQFLVAESVSIHADGTMTGATVETQIIIDSLGLNDPDYVRLRRNWMAIVRLAKANDPGFYVELLKYPDNLPDLSRLRPPGGNSRPEGIDHSHYARREREELAEVY
jgi:hypothetical protein